MDKLDKAIEQLQEGLLLVVDALGVMKGELQRMREELGDTNLLVSTWAEHETQRELKEKEAGG